MHQYQLKCILLSDIPTDEYSNDIYSVFYIVNRTDDKTVIMNHAKYFINKGCRNFCFYGRFEPKWHMVFDDVDMDINPDTGAADYNVALTSGCGSLGGFARDISLSLSENNCLLIYDDESTLHQVQALLELDALFLTDSEGDPIEGFLDFSNEVKILFILREPNSNGKEADSFWVWEKLHDRPDSVYIPSLETIAGLLIEDSYKGKNQKLKQCAYMNLYPHSGIGSIGETYKHRLRSFANREEKDADNRRKIIESLPDGTIICTLGDIASAIKYLYDGKEIDRSLMIHVNNSQKEWQAFTFKNKQGIVTVYTFYHPAYLKRKHIDPSGYRSKSL